MSRALAERARLEQPLGIRFYAFLDAGASHTLLPSGRSSRRVRVNGASREFPVTLYRDDEVVLEILSGSSMVCCVSRGDHEFAMELLALDTV